MAPVGCARRVPADCARDLIGLSLGCAPDVAGASPGELVYQPRAGGVAVSAWKSGVTGASLGPRKMGFGFTSRR